MMNTFRAASLLAGFMALTAFSRRADDPRLIGRLDAETRQQVTAIIEVARNEGLPTEPLVDLALEGASKRAAPSRIVSAVQKWTTHLRDAKRALGPASSLRDIEAGASALRAGVSVKELEKMRAARSGTQLAAAMDVMSYLVNVGVPAETVSPVIVKLVLASATDEQLIALRVAVERDIAGGVGASTAAAMRGEGLAQVIAASSTAGNSGAPGSGLPSIRGQSRAVDPLATPQAVGTVTGNANVTGADAARPAGPRGKPKPKKP